MSTEHEMAAIARELRLIRRALERISPAPEKPRESASEKSRLVVFAARPTKRLAHECVTHRLVSYPRRRGGFVRWGVSEN